MAINLLGGLTGNLGGLGNPIKTSTPQTNSTPGFLSSVKKVIAPNPYPNLNKPVQQTTQPTLSVMGQKAVSPTSNVAGPSSTLPKGQAQPIVSSTINTPPPNTNPNGNAASTGDSTFGVTDAQKNASLLASLAANSKNQPTTGPGSADPTLNNGQTPLSQTNGVTQTYGSNNPISYGGLLQQAANNASQPSADYTQQEQNANQYLDALKRSRMNEAQGLADNANNPIPLTFQQGRSQVLQNQYAQEQSALGSAYQGASNLMGAANTQQDIQQRGLLGAASGAAPVTQFGQLTSPLTGSVVSPAGGNPQLNSAVQQAMQLMKNGSNLNDAMAASGLSNFGVPGTQALTAAMQQSSGGTYSPTAANAISGVNTSLGVDYTTQASQLDSSLQTINSLAPKVSQFMTDSGINTAASPWANKPIRDYLAQAGNPGAATSFAEMISAMQTAQTGILLSSGMGVDQARNLAQSYDFANLKPADFLSTLNNLESTGQTKKGILQGMAKASPGFSGNGATPAPASGAPANPQPYNVTPPAPQSATNPAGNNPVAQFFGGAALDVFGGAMGIVSGLGKWLAEL